MEKLNSHAVALSLGLTTTVLYLICLVLTAITPLPVLVVVVNSFQHSLDLSSVMSKSTTLASIAIGIVGWFITAAFIGYIFTFLYNKLGQKFSS
ncbi:hypothetical protein HYY70_04530 [Candidatus Woesearchaeota archaeon]|nr:hypothetical protein [Candidatus Woesearchaeota archaeon]